MSHAFHNPYFDPAASVVIGLVLIGAAVLLARETGGLLAGESMDREQIAKVRKIITADVDVEGIGHLLTMQLGPDSVLLPAAVRFQRLLNLVQVERAIAPLGFDQSAMPIDPSPVSRVPLHRLFVSILEAGISA